MTSIIKVEALSGVQDDGPLCYLLQVDQVYFLLDCGWDDRFDLAYIDAIKLRIPQINAVLISYADTAHLGALPYLVKCGLNCPVYATVPVFKMGQLFLYDWLSGHNNVEDFPHFNFDDIDAAFEKVQQVKYSQMILLKGDNGLQITPYPAGHMIGGAIWRITKMGEEEIVYAVDFNHKKERHLNGASFDGIGRPNLLITDAFNADFVQQKRKQRDESLVSKLLSTVRDGGGCYGRVLEIAHLLDQLWNNKEAGLMTYNLVMLSNVASSVIESAKSQVEWMSDKILRIFEMGRHNPFQFRFVKFCHTLTDLNRVRSPKVVLVSGLDMESGFSRELFLKWCSDTKNMVIVTGRSGDRTLGSRLIRIADAREKKRPISNSITLEVKKRVPLDGIKLEEFRSRKKAKEQDAARQRLETVRRNARLDHAESSEDSDDDTAAAVAAAIAVGKNRTNKAGPSGSKVENVASQNPISANSHSNNSYDIMPRFEQHQRISFFKQAKKQFPMYPFQEEKSRWDDYGEIIRPEEYIIADAVVPQMDKEVEIKEEQRDDDDENKALHMSAEEWPTECIKYADKFEVMCKVEFIEFEGRSDGESIMKILAQIKPKQLVIVHGSPAATRHLADYCKQNNIVQGKIFTPTLGDCVDATIESHIFSVTLSDQLMGSLTFQSVKDAELSWLDARLIRKKAILPQTMLDRQDLIEIDGDKGDVASSKLANVGAEDQMDTSELDKPADGTADEMALAITNRKQANVTIPDQLYLEVLPSSNIPPHQSVFVNDPKLTDLKQLLASSGFQAEFSAGVLYVNNLASVRRNEAGRFHVEGFACEDYFRIRDIVYTQFAIV